MPEEHELERTEIEALLETRRELGEIYDRALVESFTDRIEAAVAARAAADVSRRGGGDRERREAGKRQLALGIVTSVAGIPITALTLAIGEGSIVAMVAGWAGLVGINVAHAVQSRGRAG